MKKGLPLTTKNLIGSIICGACWFVAGLMSNWHTLVSMIVTGLALIGAGVAMITVMIVGFEKGDEMSEMHFLKAKAKTYDCILLVLLIFSLVSSINNLVGREQFVVNWHAWLMMFIGIMQVISGFYFAHYEKAGD